MGIFDEIFGKKRKESGVTDKRIVEPNVTKAPTGSNDDIYVLLKRIIAEPTNRYKLKQEVGKLGRAAIKSLVDYLQADSVEFREASAIGIEGIADNLSMIDLEGVILIALDPLIKTLDDDSPTVRQAAVNALRMIIHQYHVNTKQVDMLNPKLRGMVGKTVNPLVAMLDDKSIDVRLDAAGILYNYSGSENVDGFVWGDKTFADKARRVFITGMDNESAEVREFVARKLQYDKDKDLSKKAEEILTDKSVVEPLIQALEDEDEDVRWKATIALAKMGEQRAVEPLIQALKDKDQIIRRIAALTLGEMREKRAVEPLIQAMDDEIEDVRFNATLALGKMGEQRAVEPLIQALKNKNQFIREFATTAIGKTGDERVVEPLIQALNDEYKDVRMGAARALGESKDKRAVEPLIQALKDKESCVRWVAATALGEINDTRALEPLTQALKDEHEDVRNHAKEALKKIRANGS